MGFRRGAFAPDEPWRPSVESLARTVSDLEEELSGGSYGRLVEELRRSAALQDKKTLALLVSCAADCITTTAWDEFGEFWLAPMAQLQMSPPREPRVIGARGVLHLWPAGHQHPAASAVATALMACGKSFRGVLRAQLPALIQRAADARRHVRLHRFGSWDSAGVRRTGPGLKYRWHVADTQESKNSCRASGAN
jgi:hypothetical protein